MKAHTSAFTDLQAVYKSKARADAAAVLKIVRDWEAEVGRTEPIDEKEVEAFCKSAAHVRLILGRILYYPEPVGDGEHRNSWYHMSSKHLGAWTLSFKDVLTRCSESRHRRDVARPAVRGPGWDGPELPQHRAS